MDIQEGQREILQSFSFVSVSMKGRWTLFGERKLKIQFDLIMEQKFYGPLKEEV